MLKEIKKRQQFKLGKLISALFCLVLSYTFFNLSIDRGSIWYYLLTLIFLIYFLKFSFRLLGDIYHGLTR
jgi:hypothetical protein